MRCEDDLVFDFTYAEWLRSFHSAAKELKLPYVVRPHGLRAGGATEDAMLGRAWDYIIERGRWESRKSARGYVRMKLARENCDQVTFTGDLRIIELYLMAHPAAVFYEPSAGPLAIV